MVIAGFKLSNIKQKVFGALACTALGAAAAVAVGYDFVAQDTDSLPVATNWSGALFYIASRLAMSARTDHLINTAVKTERPEKVPDSHFHPIAGRTAPTAFGIFLTDGALNKLAIGDTLGAVVTGLAAAASFAFAAHMIVRAERYRFHEATWLNRPTEMPSGKPEASAPQISG